MYYLMIKKIKRSQFVFRSYCHNVYTEKITKIALSDNNDKGIQTSDKITTYPYGYFDNDSTHENNDNNDSTHVNSVSTHVNNDNNDSSRANIHNDIDDFDKLLERAKALRKRLDTRLNNTNILIEKSKEYREMINKRTSDIKVRIEKSKVLIKNSNKRLYDIKVRTENLKNHVDDTDVLIKKSKAIRENLNKQSSDICTFLENLNKTNENTKRLNNIKVPAKNLKVFLQGYADNIDKPIVIRKELSVNIDKPIVIRKELSVNIEKTFDNIKNDLKSHRDRICHIKNSINHRKKVNCTMNQCIKEIYDNAKKNYANIINIIDNFKKDMKEFNESCDLHRCTISNITRDVYYNKKSLNYHNIGICNIKKEIGYIKNNINYRKKKIDAIKNNDNETKKQIDNSLIKLYGVSNSLIRTNKMLNLHRKRNHANKVKIGWMYYNMVYTKISHIDIKNQFNVLTNEVHTIKNNTLVSVKVDKFIRLQKNYVLLHRDMEMILKKFQYDQFLDRKLLCDKINANKINPISLNKKIKSTINFHKKGLSAIFRKKANLSRYYTEISMNMVSIIIENVYSEIVPLLHKIINKMSYTEITNDKIITYSISEIICKKKIKMQCLLKKKCIMII